MEKYISNQEIELTREITITGPEIRIGDRITVGKYTATCQELREDGAVFLLDQYLDKAYTHKDLLEKMNADLSADSNFDGIRSRMQFWDDGYSFRVPYAGEMFSGTGEEDWIRENYEPDGEEGFRDIWPLMKDRKNRIADREGEPYEWGWLMNRSKKYAANFANVNSSGYSNNIYASNSYGVRPAFCLI